VTIVREALGFSYSCFSTTGNFNLVLRYEALYLLAFLRARDLNYLSSCGYSLPSRTISEFKLT